MKKTLLFIGGVVTGAALTILVAVLIGRSRPHDGGFPGLTVFPERGDAIMTSGEIKVMQVVATDAALAWVYEDGDEYSIDMLLVLLTNNDGQTYYDDQKIDIPSGRSLRQIGTYQYTAANERVKTVPAVVIE